MIRMRSGPFIFNLIRISKIARASEVCLKGNRSAEIFSSICSGYFFIISYPDRVKILIKLV